MSSEAKDLLLKMMEMNKDKRLTAAECLKHPWFSKVTEPCVVSKTALTKTFDSVITFKVAAYPISDAVQTAICNVDVLSECTRNQGIKEITAEDVPTLGYESAGRGYSGGSTCLLARNCSSREASHRIRKAA